MDAQTQLVAELYKTLNDAQKQEVLSMIDTLLSQQLNVSNHLILIPLLRKIKIASHEKGSMSQLTKARHGATANHHGRSILFPLRKARRKFTMPDKKTESARQEVVRLISEMSDKQIMITFEAYKIQAEDETKTPEECVMLARERLNKEEKR